MSDELEFHPLADLFPLMAESSPEFKALVEDVREHGVREPIRLHEGKILDGRNRYRAALEAGVAIQSWMFIELKSSEDPLVTVASLNFHRRHLTTEQRTEVLVKLREQGLSIRAIATKTGTSKSAVARQVSRGGTRAKKVTGRDGKSYEATRPQVARDRDAEAASEIERLLQNRLMALGNASQALEAAAAPSDLRFLLDQLVERKDSRIKELFRVRTRLQGALDTLDLELWPRFPDKFKGGGAMPSARVAMTAQARNTSKGRRPQVVKS
jgi:hypothetical protein